MTAIPTGTIDPMRSLDTQEEPEQEHERGVSATSSLHPSMSEPIPAEETDCAICGEWVPFVAPCVRFAITKHGRVRLGRMHVGCAPADMNAWSEAQRGDL
jgi:hypothetical protein